MAVRSNQWVVAVSLPIVAAQAHAEDSIGYTHETYSEDHGRMEVQTESIRASARLSPLLDITVRGVYDGISGATPIVAPPIDQLRLRRPGTHELIPPATIVGFNRNLDGVGGASPTAQAVPHNTIPLAQSQDIRRGFEIAPGFTIGSHHLVPQFNYSGENDYVSWAGAINDTWELNNKNTLLNFGWSHSYDRVLNTPFTYINHRQIKNSDDFVLGVSQLLTPGTVLNVNGTIGHVEGYLNDPYRSVVFEEAGLDPNARVLLRGEQRPQTRDTQALLLSLTQAVPKLHASIEGSYRYYHDSYGIIANTAELTWFQKLGSVLVVSPSFRYYRQQAAHFYGTQFPGDPVNDPRRAPRFYSADYRLSFLEAFTVGLQTNIKLQDALDLHLGYQRYWMRGLDHLTLQSTYPSANIFSIGLTFTY